MASIAPSKGDFPIQKCSAYAPLPIKSSSDEKIAGDWCQVVLKQRNAKGEYITNFQGNPLKFTYHMQDSTKDLYGMKDPQSKIPSGIAASAISVGLWASFYMFGIIGANLIKIVIDITSIFWRVIPQLIREFCKNGPVVALANAFMAISWEIPQAVAQDIWRICRSPFHAVGMIFASLIAVVRPMEGRKWIGEIETSWHEGASFRMDIRYRSTVLDFFKQGFTKQISDIASGKLFYLGYCMAKRGNIKNDMVCGKPKYEFYR